MATLNTSPVWSRPASTSLLRERRSPGSNHIDHKAPCSSARLFYSYSYSCRSHSLQRKLDCITRKPARTSTRSSLENGLRVVMENSNSSLLPVKRSPGNGLPIDPVTTDGELSTKLAVQQLYPQPEAPLLYEERLSRLEQADLFDASLLQVVSAVTVLEPAKITTAVRTTSRSKGLLRFLCSASLKGPDQCVILARVRYVLRCSGLTFQSLFLFSR